MNIILVDMLYSFSVCTHWLTFSLSVVSGAFTQLFAVKCRHSIQIHSSYW